ncbi:MAG: TetR-like C-terminal domain-containing protein [Oscillospiraceae bacterium]|jgi:AcrR family transcriptional regulator|nr:TetR-like C-terminal domain-containing protein [Oscillospiraceae bacterium]
MANFTKQAIKSTFLELLNSHPLSEITVKMLVESCGINRKSFYYHYQDIPSLIEEISMERADEFIAQYKKFDSIGDCLSAAIDFVLSQKKLVFHIYRSMNREVFEASLLKISDYMVRSYITDIAEPYHITEDDKENLIIWYRGLFFGLIAEWLHDGMKEEHLPAFRKACLLHHGLIEQVLQKAEGESKA